MQCSECGSHIEPGEQVAFTCPGWRSDIWCIVCEESLASEWHRLASEYRPMVRAVMQVEEVQSMNLDVLFGG